MQYIIEILFEIKDEVVADSFIVASQAYCFLFAFHWVTVVLELIERVFSIFHSSASWNKQMIEHNGKSTYRRYMNRHWSIALAKSNPLVRQSRDAIVHDSRFYWVLNFLLNSFYWTPFVRCKTKRIRISSYV